MAVGSGLLTSLTNPPAAIGPLAFVSLAPLLWVISRSTARRGLLLGLAFGLAYFGATLYWVQLFGWLAWGTLTTVSAVYVALFGLLAPLVWRDEHPLRSVFALAALWTVTEYLRGMWPVGGFTWGGLGYTQVSNGFLLPLATVTGVWGVSFVVLLVNGLAMLVVGRLRARPVAAAGLAAAAAAAVLLPGIIPVPAATGRPLDVAIVQGNHFERSFADRVGEQIAIARSHARLHVSMAGNPPDLAVWPEDSLDIDPVPRGAPFHGLLVDAIRRVGAPTLVGAITGPGGTREFNQTLFYDGRARLLGRTTKVHLVPFGEYVPWRRYLDWISALDQVPEDLTPGKGIHVLRGAGLPTFGSVICFENSFPSLDRRLVAQGATFIVVATNNASFERSAASRQHLVMSRMRAVENGRWVVHAAVSGISAFVDPEGHVHQATGLFDGTVDRMTIRASSARTPYTRFGDWFPWLSMAVAGLLMLAPRTPRRGREAEPLPPDVRTLVILPTYNERDTIEMALARTLAAADVDILVVDDGSPDGTAALVRAMAEREPRVRLLEREGKGGLASAYLMGFGLALDEGYDLVVEMDADLSHQPEELPRLLEGARRFDLTVGSRYVRGGNVTNWGLLRRGLSRGGNAYTRAVLGVPVVDSTSGYRVFRRALLERLLAEGVRSDGYGFQIELAYRAWREGFAVGEVPITFREREHGHSKISRRIVFEALGQVAVWGVRDRLRRRRPSEPVAATGGGQPDD